MPEATNRINFDDVKRAVRMDQVIEFLGMTGLKQNSAGHWKGTCPFCRRIDCFVVSQSGGRDKTGAFNCFKCPAGGDQIELVSMMRGNPRKDSQGTFAAAKELHNRFIGGSAETKTKGNSLDSSPKPAKERESGFDPDSYARKLELGHDALVQFGIEPETFRQWRGGYAGSGVNRGRLALPITTKDGRIVGFFGRTVKDELPKMIFPNGIDPQEYIFGSDRITEGTITLLRDPVDVLRSYESGIKNVICFLTDEITVKQLENLEHLMEDRHCSSVCIY